MPSRVAPDLAGDGKPAGFQRSGSMARTLSVSSETHLLGPCSECEEANAEEEAVRPETGPELASCHAPPKTPCSRTVPKRGKQWTHDRRVVESEMMIKGEMCLKTMLYEMLPIALSTLVVAILDGWQQARNRFGGLFCCIPLFFLDPGWVALASYVYYFRFPEGLNASAGYELLGFVFLPQVARAVTLGFKYALYSDLLLSVDDDLSLCSQHYEKKGMQMKNQMGSYIFNFDGHQKETLLKFLYSSMLYADTDLSQCSLSYEVPSSCTSLFSPGPSPDLEAGKSHEADDEELAFENQAAIRAFWGSSLTMLDGVADHARIFDAIDTDHSGDISIDELRTALHRADETATEADVQQCFEALDADHDGRITKDEFVTSPPRRQGMEAELGKLDRLNSHVLLHPEAGLIQCIMRQTAERAGVSEQLQAGNVPCPLVAMHIVITCSDVSSYSKTRYRLLVVLPMLVTLAFFFTVLYAHLVCLCLRPCRARARSLSLSREHSPASVVLTRWGCHAIARCSCSHSGTGGRFAIREHSSARGMGKQPSATQPRKSSSMRCGHCRRSCGARSWSRFP